jgi:hypothetical protein
LVTLVFWLIAKGLDERQLGLDERNEEANKAVR